MFKKISVIGLGLVAALLASPATATTCTSYTYTIANGATADGSQVMTDLEDIRSCANSYLAPLAGPHFTGSVGIGTASPTNKLNVLGTDTSGYTRSTTPLAMFADSNPEFSIADTGNGTGRTATLRLGTDNIGYYTSGAYVRASQGAGIDTYDLAFGTSSAGAATTKMYIANGGNVGIGTTSPATALHVVGTIRQTNCTTAGTLSANGSGDIVCTSDARLKNIIGNYEGGLDALSHIDPKLFTYKPTASDPIETFVHAGFIAQNVMTVIPQASALQHDGYYSLDTTAILAAAVNSIKQLKATADRQADEIVRLKGRLDRTERQATAAAHDQAMAMAELRAETAELRRSARQRTAAR